jgi:hypothetical protein
MNLIDLLALALAGGSVTDLWFNGSIFEGVRRRFKDHKLLGCDYCVNWEATLWVMLLFYLPSLWLPSPWNMVVKLSVYWLAASYVAWLVNDIRARTEHDYMRTVRAEEDALKYGAPVGGLAVEAMQLARTAHKDLAIAFDDGRINRYCSVECQDTAARDATAQGKSYNRGIADRGDATHCAACHKPLPED